MSSSSRERKESKHLSIIDSSPSCEAARPASPPNYFGQLPAPQRGGGDEEDAIRLLLHTLRAPLTFPYTNRGNVRPINEIRVV
jgi:hypothetical protein